MATPNYSYEKRQRELAKRRKKEEKAARKSDPNQPAIAEGEQAAEVSPDQPSPDGVPGSSDPNPAV
jgi:hypothetical protein